MERLMKFLLFLLTFIFLLTSCSNESLLDKCNGVKCSNNGTCAIDINNKIVCICKKGYHAKELECVKDDVAKNPCETIACSKHGKCALDSTNQPVCVCEKDYYAKKLECLANEVIENLCEAVKTCNKNGICAVNSQNKAICACDVGYHADNTNLTCVKNITDLCKGVICRDNAICLQGHCQCKKGYNDKKKAGVCVANICGFPIYKECAKNDDCKGIGNGICGKSGVCDEFGPKEMKIIKGNFYNFVKNYDYLPDIKKNKNPNEKYVSPNTAYIKAFRRSVVALIKGDTCTAIKEATKADMKFIRYIDSNSKLPQNSPFTNEYICMMGRDEKNDKNHDVSYFRGLFCMRNHIETNTYTRNIHISIPHPLHDGDTNLEGAYVFEMSGARYFSLATAHRCSNADASSCSGTTGACGGKKAFRISDMGHNSDTLFYHFSTLIYDLDTTYHIQLHGYGTDPHINRVAIASIGSKSIKLASTRMIRKFESILTSLVRKIDSDKYIISCNNANIKDKRINDISLIRLCAETNPVGRYINGSVVNSCKNDGISFSHSKFIHLEQSRWLRGKHYDKKNFPQRFDLIVQTINQLFNPVLILESKK